ncbi:hypothetical protein BKA63DRAFT_426814 [Paraphoma chrysanthemicola]|nr:hypothetical protein BKA63DRAFT_426814 [Paraphoma chrysanthemicola]
MGDVGGKRRAGRGRGRVKRREVESEDGWTVVTHGLAGLSVNSNSHVKKKLDAGELPAKTLEGLTAEKLHANLKGLQEQWKDTAVAKQIKELVAGKSWNVKEAVCIGIGSFSRDWEHRHRSMWQLVLFLDVVEQLDLDIQMYSQDPAFTPLDLEFLRLLRIKTLTESVGAHITDSSFVYSPFVDWYILLPAFLDSKNPELYVGNDILDDYGAYAQTEEKREKLQKCNELGMHFLRDRACKKLREFEKHAHALDGMVVYWKTTTDDGDPPA